MSFVQCGRNPQILQQSDILLQRALEIDSSNTDYLIEGGYQAIMSSKFTEAIKFYKTAAKTQADNMSAVYGLLLNENRRIFSIELFFFIGIIHCQILEGKYAEAKQQIEFQNEVQTGNAAVR